MSNPTDLNKSDVDKIVAEKLGIPVASVDKVTDAFLATIIETLASGKNCDLHRFGTFENKLYAARKGRNPSTGATIVISAKNKPKFKPWKAFRDALV